MFAGQGRYAAALEEYLWALDHGREVTSAFIPASWVGELAELAAKYPPAAGEMRARRARLAERIIASARTGERLPRMDLVLFVRLGTEIGEDGPVLAAYAQIKALLPPEATLRRELWDAIEEHLVEHRRYAEAASEDETAAASIAFYTSELGRIPIELRPTLPGVPNAIAHTVRYPGAVHFEALAGSGSDRRATEVAEQLIELSPTRSTFQVLIAAALRAGAPSIAALLRQRATEVLSEPALLDGLE
jgi:hypothetical protein